MGPSGASRLAYARESGLGQPPTHLGSSYSTNANAGGRGGVFRSIARMRPYLQKTSSICDAQKGGERERWSAQTRPHPHPHPAIKPKPHPPVPPTLPLSPPCRPLSPSPLPSPLPPLCCTLCRPVCRPFRCPLPPPVAPPPAPPLAPSLAPLLPPPVAPPPAPSLASHLALPDVVRKVPHVDQTALLRGDARHRRKLALGACGERKAATEAVVRTRREGRSAVATESSWRKSWRNKSTRSLAPGERAPSRTLAGTGAPSPPLPPSPPFPPPSTAAPGSPLRKPGGGGRPPGPSRPGAEKRRVRSGKWRSEEIARVRPRRARIAAERRVDGEPAGARGVDRRIA